MALNWAPQNRWQRGNPGTADPLAPYPVAPPIGPSPPEAQPGEAGPANATQYEAGAQGDLGPKDGLRGPVRKRRKPGRFPLAWLRKVSFRSRVSILVGVAVGIAVALASLVSYIAVSRQLEGQVTSNLQNAAASLSGRAGLPLVPNPNGTGYEVLPDDFARFQERTGDALQVITQKGGFESGYNKRFFPMSARAGQALKENPNDQFLVFETVTATNGASYRVVDVPTDIPGWVVQIGYNLTDVDNTLAFLRAALILVALGGVALAAGLGWAVGRVSIRPVEDLTVAVEHVTATQDLTSTIDDEGNDELARLARSFNAMLAALAASKEQQAQLVSDAGHELRTPLTSLRTNIEVLMRTRDLPSADRHELLTDVDAQLKELTTLVGDLVDLARDDERQQTEPELVDFDEIVEHAVERAHRRATSLEFDVSLQPGQVYAQPALLERAVMNVLDNAAKWSPPGGRVGVCLEANSAWHLTVTDQGPGIAPEDLPHVFERFYRAPTARSMPGSGLGLAIVKRVVNSHGGSIELSSPPQGGTKVEIVLPMDANSSSANGQEEAV
ncbi:MAG TPA: HAMP domain-containing sensor histidine kinase [Acidimicrobiales bacterium]|nr:HAMP domain-containing sensor histidine kinase [Acidimicrobiales bacterium]